MCLIDTYLYSLDSRSVAANILRYEHLSGQHRPKLVVVYASISCYRRASKLD